MTDAAELLSEREFDFTDRHFQFLRKMVGEHAGINLGEAKRELVYGRIARRLRALGMRSFDDYCRLLEEAPDGEIGNFINAITTNLTAFFREEHHFDFLRETLIPAWLARGSRPRVRIWSAGCSTGEEPYSLAMTLREHMPASALADVAILATDIDTNVLAHAEAGVYDAARVENLPRARLQQWFKRGRGDNADRVRVVPELQQLIRFRQLNLMQDWPVKGPLDLIVCRNVVIYFDKPTQRRLFARFADKLAPRGHLIIGHSETLYNVSEAFELVGRTVYRKLN
ncbi:MAG TPA: protein-glutamate O-methyltransferase CheR [Gammaproteobacteria bacterium]|nr:protein-glutamate O-methyltransferase CheR [Gammaproteobacteria bacterium]